VVLGFYSEACGCNAKTLSGIYAVLTHFLTIQTALSRLIPNRPRTERIYEENR